jgi:hypothetical protein
MYAQYVSELPPGEEKLDKEGFGLVLLPLMFLATVYGVGAFLGYL